MARDKNGKWIRPKKVGIYSKAEREIVALPQGYERDWKMKWLELVTCVISIMNYKNISVKELSKKIEIEEDDLEAMLATYYDFDIRTISKLSVALGNNLITFPDYKHNHPISQTKE